MSDTENLTQLRKDAYSGELANRTKDELEAYAATLCHPKAYEMFSNHQFPQVSELLRIHLLRSHIDELQSHITNLNKSNSTMQKWVIALASAALISSMIQIYLQLSH